MDQVFLDCSTQDLERLRPEINRLLLAFQAMQIEVTKEMPPRDQMIVGIACLAQLQAVAERTAKKLTTPRFVRSIGVASKVARSFGVGNVVSAEQK